MQPQHPHRKDIRWKQFDYSSKCNFFVTINIHEKKDLLGEIVNGEMHLNEAGCMVRDTLLQIPFRFKGTEVIKSIVMPNHIHLLIYNGRGNHLADMMRWLKSVTTNHYIRGVKEKGWTPFLNTFWQRGYYDRVIRDQWEFDNVTRYIEENPMRWSTEYCADTQSGTAMPQKEGRTRGYAHTVLLFLLMFFVVGCADAQKHWAVPIGMQVDQEEALQSDMPLRVGAEQLMAIINTPTEGTVDLVQDLRNPNTGGIAVVANQSSLVGNTHLVDTLLACNVNVTTIFCPEHGFRGIADAGARVNDEIDSKTGLPIVSLYGKNKKPTPEQMKDIDAVIFDLQDVGCRFYTYISTLHYVMEACAERGIPCIVLDRPNPNCHYVDGPVLDMKYRSFIGMHPVPIVYGLTIGEYATMINGEHWLKDSLQCDLVVVPMLNYRRDSSYVLPVAPSPNLRNAHAIALYPSICLFEGTNVSVGRGTDTPFEIVGIPAAMCKRACSPVSGNCSYWKGKSNINKTGTCTSTSFFVAGQKAPGFHFVPKGEKQCFGIDLREIVPLNRFDLSYLIVMYNITEKGSFFKKTNSFEKLAGNDKLCRQIEQGMTEEEIRASWEPELSRYKETRKKYLLYPDVN